MIPLFKPYMPELPKIDEILHSGALAYGVYTKEFEQSLKKYMNTSFIAVTSTFSNAIAVVLSTLNIPYGSEVIASPMACLASTQPYLSCGMKIRWADIDPMRGTLLPESVEKRITSNTRAIVHNHYCGYPGYIDEINAIGKKYGIPVIDDGIECFGSEYKGKKIGRCGTDVTIFSLTAVRIPNCIDGGMIVFKDPQLYEKSLLVRDCGIERLKFRDEMGEINAECDIDRIGYSAMMSNINGYIGRRQMDEVDRLLSAHRKQAEKWDEYFYEHNSYIPLTCREGKPNYWVYGILSDKKAQAIKNFRELGYYASGVHIRNDKYSVFGEQDVNLKGVEEFYNKFVALPCGWWMEE